MVMLGHSVIPHHHHGLIDEELSSKQSKHAQENIHHSHQHVEDNKDHDHPFPVHSHISANGDFEFTRIVNGAVYNPSQTLSFIINNNHNVLRSCDHLKAIVKSPHGKKVLKNPIFRSRSHGLRAPPKFV